MSEFLQPKPQLFVGGDLDDLRRHGGVIQQQVLIDLTTFIGVVIDPHEEVAVVATRHGNLLKSDLHPLLRTVGLSDSEVGVGHEEYL